MLYSVYKLMIDRSSQWTNERETIRFTRYYIYFSIICIINLIKDLFVHTANHYDNGIYVTHRETPVRTEVRWGRYVQCKATACKRCTQHINAVCLVSEVIYIVIFYAYILYLLVCDTVSSYRHIIVNKNIAQSLM